METIPIIPQGYFILVEILKAPEKIGTLYVPEERRSREDVASPMAKVLAMGPDCFLNIEGVYPPTKYGTPRCKVGDVVLMQKYSGSKVRLAGQDERDIRLIHDKDVQAIVTDPDAVRRGE